METIAQEAKRLLEGVPENLWEVNTFSNGSGCCCAIGHYTRLKSKNPKDFGINNCHDNWRGDLRRASVKFFGGIDIDGEPVSIATVNNDKIGRYQQETPKQRVMALLDDMILWEKAQEFADTMKLSKALTDDDTAND